MIRIILLSKEVTAGTMRRLVEVDEQLGALGVEFSLHLSVNSPTSATQSQDLQSVPREVWRTPKYLDSVEEHLYWIVTQAKQRFPDHDWIWPIGEGDEVKWGVVGQILQGLSTTRQPLVLLAQTWRTPSGSMFPEPRLAASRTDSHAMRAAVSNAGPDVIAKLGAWIYRNEVVTKDDLRVWRQWLNSTTLFTHAYFYWRLVLKGAEVWSSVDRPGLALTPNPTDVDLSSVWLDWYRRRGRLFQYDWTVGQVTLLSSFVNESLLERDQVNSLTLSCSARGVLPLLHDIEWRMVNQARFTLSGDYFRVSESDSARVVAFMCSMRNPNTDLYLAWQDLVSRSDLSARRRLWAYKHLRFIWDQAGSDKWQHLRLYRVRGVDVLRRQNHVALIPADGTSIECVLRDSSEGSSPFEVPLRDLDRKGIGGLIPPRGKDWYCQAPRTFSPALFAPFMGFAPLQLRLLAKPDSWATRVARSAHRRFCL